ncbi:MAG: HAMP domain-containing protein [Chloroflexi bacterium]|nr:HAMP domain-containing protein [Chloroflexota bacterium]OJV91775.1 MAG: hypothetical protein BGO39_17950 [Chloroflexi bacterium 54-19]
MSIRARLALCAAVLSALVLLLVELLSYSLHARGHYDDLDRLLIADTEHAVNELERPDGPLRPTGGSQVILLLYSDNSILLASTNLDQTLPQTDPQKLLTTPNGETVDPFAQLAPSFLILSLSSEEGVFRISSTPEQRWRIYLLPLSQTGKRTGYLEALIPMGWLDVSLARYRITLIGLWLIGALIALVGGRVMAGRTLRPIAKMLEAAESIGDSHNFSLRLDSPAHMDELGKLAATFNKMLASLESAYLTQQRFISDASHELRAPLAVIQGNLEILQRQPRISSLERGEILTETEDETARMTRLVSDLLALARADAGLSLAHRTVDLDVLVFEEFKVAQKLAKGQKLVLEPFEPVCVEGDEDRLRQLLLILLDNALKYTPGEGWIMLGLRTQKDKNKDMAEITVKDTGVGIAEKDLPHLFERFYRADPSRGRNKGGAGLGLSIAKWIVEQHEGQIELNSTVGKGTTVIVRLKTVNKANLAREAQVEGSLAF